MPTYTYLCPHCGETQDRLFPMSDFPDQVQCDCGKQARKIITPVAVQCDSINDVPWLESACQNLQPDGEKPIQSRAEYKKYLREHHIVERE